MVTRPKKADRQQFKNRRRLKIIESAIAVFAQRGFYNAKVSMIAKKAGIADGTVYLYFKSKDDMLISIFEEKMEAVIETQVNALVDKKNALEMLSSFAMVHLNLIRDNPALAELLQVELRQSSKFMKNYHHDIFLQYLNIIGNIFAQGVSEGIFRDDIKISVAKIAFFGALDEFATQWILLPPKNLEIEEAARQICEMFINGLKKN